MMAILQVFENSGVTSVTLNQIRAFAAVAQYGGFTAAARALGVSHSTLNSQVQMLEREYGAELFHRWDRRVELSGQPLLMREPGSTTRKALEDALLEHKVTVRVAMEIGSREALREAVARRLGVGTVSRSEYVPDPGLSRYGSTATWCRRISMSAACASGAKGS
jgi:DNA-binding transcriptional LysR family regulator